MTCLVCNEEVEAWEASIVDDDNAYHEGCYVVMCEAVAANKPMSRAEKKAAKKAKDDA